MIDPMKYTYHLVLATEKGDQNDITNFVEDLGWEEQENELASRLSCTAKNEKTAKGRLSAMAKPGCYVYLYYRYGNGEAKEAMSGRIVEWNPSAKNSSQPLKIKVYDNLYDLQESKDNIFFADGTRTRQMISDFLSRWGVKLAKYTGPNVTHGATKEANKKLGSIILDILKEAKKKGGGDAVIRSVKGNAQVLGVGENDPIYHFEESENLTSVSHRISTAGMVTRVKVLGEEDDDGRRPIEATVDGKTEFGIRQEILIRGTDESIEDAKKAAEETLEEDGEPTEEIEIVSPDIPEIRKGDIVHVKMSTGKGYYQVLSIAHDCDQKEMSMNLKKTKVKAESGDSADKGKGTYSVGDTVNFHGGTHYVASDSSQGYSVSAGKAKITYTNPGSAHPWHLETLNWAETHVYGWVDDGSFD